MLGSHRKANVGARGRGEKLEDKGPNQEAEEGQMKQVNESGRKQLLGYLINERQSQDQTRDWIITWLDTWCPVDPELIERVMTKVREAEGAKTKTKTPRKAE